MEHQRGPHEKIPTVFGARGSMSGVLIVFCPASSGVRFVSARR